MKYLVVVESPSKCKTIQKYLNDNDDLNIYEVVATMGHITELPSLKNINAENNFECTYEIIESKKRNISLIKKKIKEVDEVILACDNDREGETINYHICMQFNLPLNIKRIIFNEITEKAIQYAIQNPQTININIVNAQKTRQILDILVGFKMTPLLWKHIYPNKSTSLSLGRCQTPALKIIYDNYISTNSLEERKIYNIFGYFTNMNLSFELNHKFENDDDAIQFLENSIIFNHVYTCSTPKKVIKFQPEPYITSTLQQDAINKLGFSAKETMQIAQSLYEEGYITYMRTDSKKYSEYFINIAKEYILQKYNTDKYINKDINNLICENDTHESIRITNISLLELPSKSDLKEKKLYRMIWEHTLESCLPPAIYSSITAQITSSHNSKVFQYTNEKIDFLGWHIVTNAPISYENKIYNYLQTIKQNEIINYTRIAANMTFHDIKRHYTEAKLIQILEQKGIGRPSTYSSLVEKIQDRKYVVKKDIKGKEVSCINYELKNGEICETKVTKEFGNEKNKLVIQPLGIQVMEFVDKHLYSIFNYDFTEQMENQLDKISRGEQMLVETCSSYNMQLDELIEAYQREQANINVSINMDLKNELQTNDNTNTKTNTKTNNQNIIGKYNNEDVIIKRGKYGLYMTWGDKTKSLKELGNRPIENISFDEIKKYILEDEDNKLNKREISKNISIRNGPRGHYIYYKTEKMKKPMFYSLDGFMDDYNLCDNNTIKLWIKDTYNIS